jgi:hypothetical protein
MAGRYLVLLRGRQLPVTYTEYNLLVELILSRRDPAAAGFANAKSYPFVSRVAVCRLRRAIDDILGPRAGLELIATGAGEEYRLNLTPDEIAIHPSMNELLPLRVLAPTDVEALNSFVKVVVDVPELDEWRPSQFPAMRRDHGRSVIPSKSRMRLQENLQRRISLLGRLELGSPVSIASTVYRTASPR